MLNDLWKTAKSLISLADALERYHSEIKEIRQELKDLTIIVHALAQEVRHGKEQSALVKENILLEVEKRLQALDKQLPPVKKDRRPPKTSKKKR